MNDFSLGNVLAITFSGDASAYQAITKLQELDAQGQLQLVEASIVTRSVDGQLSVKDDVANDSYAGTASGGLIGLIIGVLGGPLGVLLGGATGLLVGSLFDLDDMDDTDSVLSDISKTVTVGNTALLAQVIEQSADVVDQAMAALGGTVVRRSTADVEAEIAAAEKAQRKAKHEARKELRKARHEKHQQDVDEKVAALKAKLHHEKTPATTA